MHLRSLRLRNYRVYRAADIEFPDGLVGIYGPNGAGKSSIIESVRYALYGDARTEKSELRTAGINEDVRVELVFEHEGNSYEVRRVLKGRNLTPTVEVYVNRQLAAQSARDANAYLGRVLGMDQRAFLASVCAQQKELTTFATMVPSERRRLVLDLLGVSPIERALVHVREEARDARTAAGGARAQLPDLPAAESAAAEAASAAGVADVAAEAAGAEAETAATALAAAGLIEARDQAEAAVEEVEGELAAMRERHAHASELLGAAAARLEAATAAAERCASLDPEAPCPTCGQVLGEALAEVTARHDQELAAARQAHRLAAAAREAAVEAGRKLAARRDERRRELERARADEVVARQAELERLGDPGFDADAHQRAKNAAEALQPAALAVGELRGRVERAVVERGLAREALDRAVQADARAEAVEAEAGALGKADQALAVARERVRQAGELARRTHGEHQRAAEALAAARRRHDDLERALAAARARHEEVAELEERAAYLARLVDLMAAFRLHLVARLGRRLSVEAAELFAELTDHEYQDLVVDPEDYSIRIADQGTEYELARYSGSENDLASLSLRVAVSLVIAEGAGELGLLVLDEVLGSLDRERRERMLAALTTLQGRFRQVLLVTHNDEVKDLLPAAIEVHKGPHRTSTVGLRG